MASVMPRRGRGRTATCLSMPAPAVLAMSALALASLVGCGGDDAVIVGTPGAQTPSVSGTSSPAGSSSGNAQAGSGAGGPASTSSDPTPAASRTSTRNLGTGTSGATGAGATVPWQTGGAGRPVPTDLPSAASGPAQLSILLDDGSGARSTWTLTCEPAGGTHPEPADACGVLGARGATAFPVPPADAICSQQFGGPQQARITGTWRGSAVSAELSLENGCQINRWTALLGLLPPGGP